ncbi:two-component system, chemotaxis family, response regulator WspR [Azospirillaceae bacterium]
MMSNSSNIPSSSVVNTPKHKILIVDDVISNIQIMSRILKNDYEVFFAANGEKALDIAGSKFPDIILLDVMMPGMDGYEVCSRLKSNIDTQNIPVIFVSARDDLDAETHGLDVGAIDFITKPFNPLIVKARIRNHLTLKRQADQLRRLSFIDGLTGIANRRRFQETLEREWRRCRRNQFSLGLFILDVDNFKAYNDGYGHQAGDECLRLIAQAINCLFLRSGDLAARYGGEEFVCLVPETDLDGALALGGAIRGSVIRLEIPHAWSPTAPFVTVSVGGAAMVPPHNLECDDLLALCDRRLYEAKRTGRNRVVIGPWEAASNPPVSVECSSRLMTASTTAKEEPKALASVKMIAKRKNIEAGFLLGKADSVLRLLRHRFGSTSPDIEARLWTSDVLQLNRWFDRALDAPTLDAVFITDQDSSPAKETSGAL